MHGMYFEYKGSTDNLVTRLPNRSAPVLRLNAICPYYTMFPLRFPFKVLRRAQKGDWVLDPFCGRGTTNFAARLRGLPSVGIDSNPVAGAIAAAKFVDVTPEEVIDLCNSILRRKKHPEDIPEGEFWEFCYHPSTLFDICKIREYLLENCSTEAEIALRGLILGILHGPKMKNLPTYLSNQMPRTYATKPKSAVRFWKKHDLKPPKVDVADTIARRAKYVFEQLPLPTQGAVYIGDSRLLSPNIAPEPFRWVITSPPYFGMRSYLPDQWLRYWFLGGPSTVTYSLEGQIPHCSEDEFVRGLANVWKRVASVCAPNARLIVRFGAIPSAARDPKTLLKKSLSIASAGWKVATIKNAGLSPRGRRQAGQFGCSLGKAVEEIDLYAVLEE
ncbi:DNA methyltransferase [Calderihabitans maritimus]|uniref:site-specific DNA-methyltransferase (cytosine-N(4)-specific) n=1 Tax=Calderihabitans maritimus TaxID=1246530 RepID=A0A1Z5HXW3_9FIRM|nr:DNA methyltransferase [Calderihabitans maritimus]GAW94366.1 DNA modification methylase [Calderihabitans maritimus]